MFCDRCGAENKDTASFCRKCGQQFDSAEVETRIAARRPAVSSPAATGGATAPNRSQDPVLFEITPTLLFVKGGYALAAVGALLVVALITGLTNVSVLIAISVGLLLFLIPAYFHVRQKLLRYTLTGTTLQVASGLLATTTRNVPLSRIQDVTVSATAMQRIAGLGDIVIDNASEDGGKVVLHNIDSPRLYSERLLRQMANLEK